MEPNNLTQKEVIQANIKVHTAISDLYNNDSHWRPENLVKVRAHLQRIAEKVPSRSKLLDIGCGTGFIINLAKDLFTYIAGIDITPAMLEKVDTSNGNIELFEIEAENTGFEEDCFDMVTAYSFLDHLFSIEDVLKETYRILKPGGIFYADLNPNRDFWVYIESLAKEENILKELKAPILREVNALSKGDTLSNNKQLNKTIMNQSEPGKSYEKGFSKATVEALAKNIGFSTINIEYDWFMGQAELIHDYKGSDVEVVEHFLKRTLPASSHYFKYLRIELTK